MRFVNQLLSVVNQIQNIRRLLSTLASKFAPKCELGEKFSLELTKEIKPTSNA